MRRAERVLACLAVCCAALATRDARACGWDFPDSFLGAGDGAVLSLEARNFSAELARIPRPALPETAFAAVPDLSGRETDLEEIEASLRSRGDAEADVERVVRGAKAFRDELDRLPDRAWERARARRRRADAPNPAPAPPEGLPAVFERYLRGAAAWRAGDVLGAREAWRSVLELPPEERRPREVWAQFMLGRSLVDDRPSEAVRAFARVRELVLGGAPDPVGLAAASAGWEARAELRRGRPVRAVRLYHALGDERSLLAALREAFASAEAVAELAADGHARRIGTAYVVSGGADGEYGSVRPAVERVAQWLGAVEAADAVGGAAVTDADRLAWIAYDAGEFETARRWLRRAAEATPLSARIETKLLLRDGRLQEASQRLADAARALPPGDDDRARLCADRGTLELARGEFTSALDALLGAGRWLDAAYVAERVLTADELARYVRTHVPQEPGATVLNPSAHDAPGDLPCAAVHALLARRLARGGRWDEAVEHLPAELRPSAWAFVAHLRAGRDETADPAARATALRDAARILRTDGMELVGTELDPDWHAYGGDYEFGGPAAERAALAGQTLAGPTPEERSRVEASAARPQERFHYRYLAADLAWDAASLMPDGEDATAAWLAEAGGWLADRDPEAADRFYKALVRRCGATSLGREAAAVRWFPRPPR